MTHEYAIEADGLRKRYGQTTVLDGLDLRVPRASVLALLGPNGAGKTTAVRLLSTLTTPDGGRATVAGHDVVADARRRAPGDQPDRAVRGARRAADRHREPADDRTGWRACRLGRHEPAPPNCSTDSSSSRRALGGSGPIRAACAGGWTSRRRWSAPSRCCSSTSRRPDWTRAAACGCGSSSPSCEPPARPCC